MIFYRKLEKKITTNTKKESGQKTERPRIT